MAPAGSDGLPRAQGRGRLQRSHVLRRLAGQPERNVSVRDRSVLRSERPGVRGESQEPHPLHDGHAAVLRPDPDAAVRVLRPGRLAADVAADTERGGPVRPAVRLVQRRHRPERLPDSTSVRRRVDPRRQEQFRAAPGLRLRRARQRDVRRPRWVRTVL